MDTIWEAYTKSLDWEGYEQSYTIISLHRSREGAEEAVEAFKECYPSLAENPRYRIDIQARKLED